MGNRAGPVAEPWGATGRPAIPGLAAADILSATMALSGVLMALLRRQATGARRLPRRGYGPTCVLAGGAEQPRIGDGRAASTLMLPARGRLEVTRSMRSTRRRTGSGWRWADRR